MKWDYQAFQELDWGARALVEWQYGLAGDFQKHLFETISLADSHNLNKLALGFPDEVGAYRSYTGEEGYWPGIVAAVFPA